MYWLLKTNLNNFFEEHLFLKLSVETCAIEQTVIQVPSKILQTKKSNSVASAADKQQDGMANGTIFLLVLE